MRGRFDFDFEFRFDSIFVYDVSAVYGCSLRSDVVMREVSLFVVWPHWRYFAQCKFATVWVDGESRGRGPAYSGQACSTFVFVH
jgi:hypothetical protein